MRNVLITLFLIFSPVLFSKEILYSGDVSFRAETNVPGLTIEGSSKIFKKLSADFSDDLLTLKKIEVELDAQTLKTGIDLRDQHMFEKVFLVLSAKEKPALLKMNLDKATCEKTASILIKCNGEANFLFGKKAFSKKIELNFDKNQNTDVSFNISLKELAIEIPSYLGIELEDSVVIKMKVFKK